MAAPYVFTMIRLNKSYGPKKVLKNISLSFFPGAKIGVVGDNGAGKSTLLRIMAGVDQEFQGHAAPEKGVRVRLAAQEPELDWDATVRENVEAAFAPIKTLLDEYDEVSARLASPLDPEAMDKAMKRLAELQDAIDAADGWDLQSRIDRAADALVLPPDDLSAGRLSGGERRRVALCRVLLERPDVLLLDEPTNHLDAETVEWLEAQLREYPGTVIVVTHDRYFLDRVTEWILELDHGEGIPFRGNYSGWIAQKLEGLARVEKRDSSRRRSLERELRWIRMSAADRREQSRARLAQYEQMLVHARAEADDAEAIEIPAGPPLGQDVLSFESVAKGYGDLRLIKNLSFVMPRGAVVGVVGPNGAGKTTLFRLITGEEAPDAGRVRLGSTVQLASVHQQRDALDPAKTVWEEISGGEEEILVGTRRVASRAYVGRFNFKGPDQQKKVGDLSGGERNRVHLAKLVRRGGNLLLLDEPTNDLDVGALRLFEDALNGFVGCAMVISHDRFFLDRVCTHLLVFEGEGRIRWFEGNFQDYERARREELGEKAFAGRRSRYRTLRL